MQPARSPNATIRRPRNEKAEGAETPAEKPAEQAAQAEAKPESKPEGKPEGFDARWDARPQVRREPQGRPQERFEGPRPPRREVVPEARPERQDRPARPPRREAPEAAEAAPRPERQEEPRQEPRQEERREPRQEERQDRPERQGRRPVELREEPRPLPARGSTDFAGLQEIANLPKSEMAALMAGVNPRGQAQRLRRGQRVEGKLSRITSAAVFVDIGGKADAILEGRELPAHIKPGDFIEAFVASSPFEGEVRLTLSPSGAAALDMLEEAREHRTIISGKVQSMNEHGYEIQLNGGIRGFCPTSQIDVPPVADPAIYVGQSLGFRILEVKGREAIVTHRSVAEEEAAAAAAKLFETMREGDVYEGTVTKLKEFGAFVRLPNGLEGLVHLSNISKDRIAKPEEKLKEGQEVKVKVLSVDPAQRRLSLGIKQAERETGAIGDTRNSDMRQTTSFGLMAGLLANVKPKKAK